VARRHPVVPVRLSRPPCGYGATLLRPGALASFDISAQPISLSYLIAFVSMVAIGGPLMEEPGWTGFAQLRMKRLHGPLVGGLILGSFWGCGTCQGS
jgi:CAAX protease family protein